MDMPTDSQNKKLQTLRQFLVPGEMLLWHGAPKGGVRLLKREKNKLRRIPLICAAVAFAIVRGIVQQKITLKSPVIILILVLLSYCFLDEFIMGAFRRKHLYYGVTNQRVILTGKDGMVGLPYSQVTGLSLELHKDKIGTVHLTPPVFEERNGKQVETANRLSLLFIPDCFRVYDLIKAQKELYEQSTLSETT